MNFAEEIDLKIDELQKKHHLTNSDTYIALRNAESRYYCKNLRKWQPKCPQGKTNK
jgi:hypothetical protein